jgi:hypothetical protein
MMFSQHPCVYAYHLAVLLYCPPAHRPTYTSNHQLVCEHLSSGVAICKNNVDNFQLSQLSIEGVASAKF